MVILQVLCALHLQGAWAVSREPSEALEVDGRGNLLRREWPGGSQPQELFQEEDPTEDEAKEMEDTKKAVQELFDEEKTSTTGSGARLEDLEKTDGTQPKEGLSDEERAKIAAGVRSEMSKGEPSDDDLAASEKERVRLARLRAEMQGKGDGSWIRWDEVDLVTTNESNTTMTTTAGLLWSDENEDCLQPESIWKPLDMMDQNRTSEPDHRSCRARCKRVEGCAHWSYYLLGGACFLQNASATKSAGKGTVSGIPGCRDRDPNMHFGLNAGGQGCYHLSASYTPLDMPGTARNKEASYEMCQARCLETRGCVRFTYFIVDQGCHLQANGSHMVFLPGTITGGSSCSASDKAKFDAYIKHLPTMRSVNKETDGIPCEDSWANFMPFDLPGDLDEPGDIAKDKEVKCAGLYSQHLRATICKYSMQVRQRCPVLCGMCGIETLAEGCVDNQKDEHPLFYLGNQTLSCASLEYACRHDNEVDEKCKDTCGLCTTTTTTKAVVEDAVDKATGCSRRRSMGYCFTRRRRLF
mmetsp:Transcript_1290/g.2997  ORF Transcript_1290/g.2997 Transcript_1290/m.2997 type:complete len:525 (+) Transcript_1290:116-1690(+)